jgi:hypothetical protein
MALRGPRLSCAIEQRRRSRLDFGRTPVGSGGPLVGGLASRAVPSVQLYQPTIGRSVAAQGARCRRAESARSDAQLLGDPAQRRDAALDLRTAGRVALLHRLDELASRARGWCRSCRMMGHRVAHRLGPSLWSVEPIGERVNDRHEVIELLLQLGHGGGRVVGRFGFVAQPGCG